jgi:hypothetical protein
MPILGYVRYGELIGVPYQIELVDSGKRRVEISGVRLLPFLKE